MILIIYYINKKTYELNREQYEGEKPEGDVRIMNISENDKIKPPVTVNIGLIKPMPVPTVPTPKKIIKSRG